MTIIDGSDLTGLYIGRCPSCKRVNTRRSPRPWYSPENFTCECKRVHKVRPVVGTVSRTECGPRCTSAIGPACDCKCGGENHGSAHH